MIYNLNIPNKKNYVDIAVNNKISHAVEFKCFIYLMKGITYTVFQNAQSVVGDYINDSYITIFDTDKNIKNIHYGIENFSFSVNESGMYILYSRFGKNTNGIKSIQISPLPSDKKSLNTLNFHKINEFELNESDKYDDSIYEDREEIPLQDSNTFFVNSDDILDFRYPILNIISKNEYALFREISASDESSNESVNIYFNFPALKNVNYILMGFQFNNDELNQFVHFRFSISLYVSNDSNNWNLINTVYPCLQNNLESTQIQNELEENTLYIADNLNQSNNDVNVLNLRNPKMMIEFQNHKNYKYYRLELKALSNEFISFKLNQLKCFSNKNYPIARFPLENNTNEINDFVKNFSNSISFQTVSDKRCAYFNSTNFSNIMLPKTFLSGNMKELTISLFAYVTNIADDKTYMLISKEEESGYNIGIKKDNTNIIVMFSIYVDSYKVTLKYTTSENDFYNVWNHIAVTADDEKIILYFNGEEREKIYIGGNINYGKESENGLILYNMYIGCENDNHGQSNYFNGYMREITFYKKALIKNQIYQIYLKRK